MEPNATEDPETVTQQIDEKHAASSQPDAIPEVSSKAPSVDPKASPVTVKECVAHLKFLAAVAQLRETVSSTPGLFDIDEAGESESTYTPEVLQRVREKKWQVYVSRAVDRFTRWWSALAKYDKRPTVTSLKQFRMNPLGPHEHAAIQFMKEMLPPLDILMVWHTFMLNPRAYLEDSLRQAKMNVWCTAFPLELIASCITPDDENRYQYDPGEGARRVWVRLAQRHWDNVDDSWVHNFACQSCLAKIKVPWTTAHIAMISGGAASRPGGPNGFDKAKGYADWWFQVVCPECKVSLDHEYLPILKFRRDNLELLQNQVPLPGTLFNSNGVVKLHQGLGTRWTQLAPNYYFAHFEEEFLKAVKKGEKCRSMRQLADAIYKDLYQRDRRIKVLGLSNDLRSRAIFGGTLGRGRGALRRMMSRYWGNSSIFALDLVGAVMRQGTFISKMQQLDWLHMQTATGLDDFMQRSIQKYGVFWSIIVNNPSKIAVPTLDVDLVWHTHQLSPRRYYAYSLETTKVKKPARFVDHNDKIDEGKLSDSFEWTVKQYRKATKGMAYSECFCWYCEATRGEGLLDKLSSSPSTTANKDAEKESSGNIHISAHNAVRARTDVLPRSRKGLDKLVKNQEKILAATEQDTSKQTVKRDGKNGVLEVFAPEPRRHQDAYTNNPGCMAVSVREGSCVSGTCGASLAAGSCGGSNFASACSSGQRRHGRGFLFVTNGSAGGGGGVGCGGGGC